MGFMTVFISIKNPSAKNQILLQYLVYIARLHIITNINNVIIKKNFLLF